MAKILKRSMGALQAQKFQFDVEVLQCTELPLADAQVYVCWTRGAHLATTKEAAVDMKGAAVFNQKLSLLCTMYQSSSGKFQEKMSKLAFKIKKKSKSVSSHKFDLAQYIKGPSFTSDVVVFDLSSEGGMFSADKAGGSLYVKISATFLPPDAAGDTFTEMSTGSEQVSTMSMGEDLSDDEDDGSGPPPALGAISLAPNAMMMASGSPAQQGTPGKGGEPATNPSQAQEISDLLQKLEGLNKMISSQTDLNQKLVSENGNKETEGAKLKAVIENLTAANIELSTRKTSLESSMSDRDAEIARLNKDKEDAALAAGEECAALMAKIEGASLEGGESMDFAKKLQEQLAKKETEISELRGASNDAQSALHEVEAMRNKLSSELEKESDNHAATTIERDTLMQELGKGSGALATAQSIASSDREKNELLDEKIALQKEVSELKVMLATSKASPKQHSLPLSLDGASKEVSDHVSYLEMELVTTKINWAQAEEEKDLAWFKVRDVKKQLQKSHDTNRSFAKRMTQLEVNLSTEKQKNMAMR